MRGVGVHRFGGGQQVGDALPVAHNISAERRVDHEIVACACARAWVWRSRARAGGQAYPWENTHPCQCGGGGERRLRLAGLNQSLITRTVCEHGCRIVIRRNRRRADADAAAEHEAKQRSEGGVPGARHHRDVDRRGGEAERRRFFSFCCSGQRGLLSLFVRRAVLVGKI